MTLIKIYGYSHRPMVILHSCPSTLLELVQFGKCVEVEYRYGYCVDGEIDNENTPHSSEYWSTPTTQEMMM